MNPPDRPERPALSVLCCPLCGAVYVGDRQSLCPTEKLMGTKAHAAL